MHPDSQTLRLLIADDAATNRQLAGTIFGNRGHQVQFANDGREAIACFEAQPYDAVLMDVHMPNVDGPTATAAIRAGETDRAAVVPIVGISAFTALSDRREYLLAGMDGFLSRPVDVALLLQVVEGLAQALQASKFTAHSKPTPGPQGETGAKQGAVDGPTALLRCGGDSELFRQLVAAFEQRATSLLSQAREAMIAQQPAIVRSSTLRLARLAATSAAGGLLRKCQELAVAAETPSWRSLTTRFAGLAGEIEMTARELGCFSATLSADSISI
ncbi:MAG: response regulator [Pirellulales bacterium]